MMEGRGVVNRDAPEGEVKGCDVRFQRRRQLHDMRARIKCSSALTHVESKGQWLLCVWSTRARMQTTRARARIQQVSVCCRIARDHATPLCQL